MDEDDSEFDADYVVSFTHAEDDELAEQDAEAELHTTPGTGGCFAVVLLLMIAVVLSSSFS